MARGWGVWRGGYHLADGIMDLIHRSVHGATLFFDQPDNNSIDINSIRARPGVRKLAQPVYRTTTTKTTTKTTTNPNPNPSVISSVKSPRSPSRMTAVHKGRTDVRKINIPHHLCHGFASFTFDHQHLQHSHHIRLACHPTSSRSPTHVATVNNKRSSIAKK